jgi:hypothetical protein
MGKKFKNFAAKLSQVNDFWDRPEALAAASRLIKAAGESFPGVSQPQRMTRRRFASKGDRQLAWSGAANKGVD